MASARELEKFLTNSPYLPSFDCLMRSRHRGRAMARISSSVLSTMLARDSPRAGESGFAGLKTYDMPAPSALLVFPDQVIAGRLLHGVFTGFRVAARNRQHVPVRVVHLHGVAPVVVARPTGLLAEQRVLRDALRSAMAVLQFPRTQQLVNILRRQILEVFLHDLELLET